MAGYPRSEGQVQLLRPSHTRGSVAHYGPSNSLGRANRKSCRSCSLCSLVPQSKVRIETVQPTVPPSAVGRRTVGHDMQAVNRQGSRPRSLSPRMPLRVRNSNAGTATPRRLESKESKESEVPKARRASRRPDGGDETKAMNLQRFCDAQRDTFDRALQEICQGRKSSCWMWFMIPTPPHIVNGVERGSSVNRKFALRSNEEARAFLHFEDDGVNLRDNYVAIMTAILEQLQSGRTPTSLLGHFDAPKLASSVQLFDRISREGGDLELHRILQEIKPYLPKKSAD